jgi:hypothetical protein
VALPTFFIIGAVKTGTTSLHHYLGLHPEIQMSAVKETNFFSGPADGVPYPVGQISALGDYEALFDPAFGVRGEASPGYSNHPRRQGVPERIKELVPAARFVYIVRDPIERAVSEYQMQVAAGLERREPGEALVDLREPRLSYVPPGLYAAQIERYLRHFPIERILVLDNSELLAQRRRALREAFAFLGVEETVDSPQFDEELMSSRQWRAYPSGYAALMRRVAAPARKLLPKERRRVLRESVERRLWAPLEKPVIDGPLRERLEELYADDLARFRKITGKAFPSWSI